MKPPAFNYEDYEALKAENEELKAEIERLKQETCKLNRNNNIEEKPCAECIVGWGSISSAGVKTCHETCERLKTWKENNNGKNRNL